MSLFGLAAFLPIAVAALLLLVAWWRHTEREKGRTADPSHPTIREETPSPRGGAREDPPMPKSG